MATVNEVMSERCKTLALHNNVYQAALLMKEQDIGFVPVVEQGQVVGVITDRDIVIRGIAEKHPNSADVATIMTEQIIAVRSDMTSEEAAQLMATHQVRRLPVIDSGQLVGVVSLGDLATLTPQVHEAGSALSEISESTHH